jgi:hypothetical protein
MLRMTKAFSIILFAGQVGGKSTAKSDDKIEKVYKKLKKDISTSVRATPIIPFKTFKT